MTSEALEVIHPLPAPELSVDELIAQSGKIEQAMRQAMQKDVHYGVIPGVAKPSLFKPGAEKLLVLFRLGPYFDNAETWHDDGHYTVRSTCRLEHIPSGNGVGSGDGLCSTREGRYAYRNATPTCPACGSNEFLLKSKNKPEFFCWRNPSKGKNGCGATFPDSDPAITSQSVGKIPNPDLPDSYNTVLKMAQKRALVAAVLNATAASDVFTQDVEDHHPVSRETPRAEARADDDIPFVVREEKATPPSRDQIAELQRLQGEIVKRFGSEMWGVQWKAALTAAGVDVANPDPDQAQAASILVHLRLVVDPGIGEPA